jgi:hypothetical protein
MKMVEHATAVAIIGNVFEGDFKKYFILHSVSNMTAIKGDASVDAGDDVGSIVFFGTSKETQSVRVQHHQCLDGYFVLLWRVEFDLNRCNLIFVVFDGVTF